MGEQQRPDFGPRLDGFIMEFTTVRGRFPLSFFCLFFEAGACFDSSTSQNGRAMAASTVDTTALGGSRYSRSLVGRFHGLAAASCFRHRS